MRGGVQPGIVRVGREVAHLCEHTRVEGAGEDGSSRLGRTGSAEQEEMCLVCACVLCVSCGGVVQAATTSQTMDRRMSVRRNKASRPPRTFKRTGQGQGQARVGASGNPQNGRP